LELAKTVTEPASRVEFSRWPSEPLEAVLDHWPV
jgi:hypothetical protein